MEDRGRQGLLPLLFCGLDIMHSQDHKQQGQFCGLDCAWCTSADSQYFDGIGFLSLGFLVLLLGRPDSVDCSVDLDEFVLQYGGCSGRAFFRRE